MNTPLWADRLIRMSGKTTWSAWSSLITRPHVELIHQRDIPGEPEGYEFVRRCVEPTYIEPVFGYAISGNGYLIEESLLPNFPYPKPPWRVGLASPKDFYKAQRGTGKRITHHSKVISLRHFWEWNYYHFYLDVLGKIQLFDKIGIDPTTPIILGRYAIELPFVQQVISQGDLKQRNWIVQDNNYVLADEVYYCRTRQSYKDKIDHVLDLMRVPNHLDRYSDRIFLARKRDGPRSIANMDHIEPIVREYGFRIIDTAELSIAEQIDLFSKVRYLLAVHGAGMTNMIFRRDAPMSVLEIHATTYVSEDFRNMCHEWGYQFDRLACFPSGSANPQHASIHIDPLHLRQKIEHMLKVEDHK
jgi:hypothetical protein